VGRHLRLLAAVTVTAAFALGGSAGGALALPDVGAPAAAPQLPAAPVLPSAPAAVPAPPAPSLPAAAPAIASAPPLPGVGAVVAAEGAARPAAALRLNGGGASGGSTSIAGPAAAGSPATARRVARAQERSESRRLRAEVERLKGCLGVLPELARNLIEMRAGIEGPAMTRRAAAKELRIGVARARRIERRGLRAMRKASRQGLCGTGGGTAPATYTGFRSETASASLVTPAASVAAAVPAAGGSSPHAKQPARHGVLGATAASPPPAPKPAPLPGSRVALTEPGGHGHALVISLVLLLLAANLLAGGVWLLRRRSERASLAAATGQRRPYADPGHELRFGSEGDEAPERPAEAERPAAVEDPDRW
jgi:hypothetical protein